MIDPKWQDARMVQATLAFKDQLTQTVSKTTDKIFRKSTESPLGNLKRKKSTATGQCATIATAMAVMMCELDGIEWAGTAIVTP